jgi:hypothetical protein
LSFNKKTGAISGVPIVASDPVIYTVTAIGRRGRLVLMVMSGSSTTLKAFKETDMMATARSLVSLLSAFVMFFIFKNND